MNKDKRLIDYWASMCKQLDETSTEIFNRLDMINEMAVSLKEYQSSLEDLRFQIIENWCLCKWCQLFNPTNKDFNHWKKELKAFIQKLKFIKIKNNVDKKKILNRVWIDKCDMKDSDMISKIIIDKFNGEGIIDIDQKNRVALAFTNEIEGLIDSISNTKITPIEYIQTTFNCL